MSDKHRNPAIHAATAAYIATLLEHLLPPLREVARNHGYALAVHGSLARDIDLVAIPWTEQADDADKLVRSLCGALMGVVGTGYVPKEKEGGFEWSTMPHGRRAVTFHYHGEGYIDLSVMPLVPKVEAEDK